MENWKDQLATRWSSILKARKGNEEKPTSEPRVSVPRNVEINLGIDFGTSFTKVCYRILGRDIVGLIPFSSSPGSWECTMHPSRLFMEKSGTINFSENAGHDNLMELKYFKMHLAGMAFGYALEGKELSIPPSDLLCAFYLAYIIRYSKMKIIAKEDLRDVPIKWSGNLGIPIGYYESKARERFENVLKVAVTASSMDNLPSNPTLKDLEAIYIRYLESPTNDAIDYFLISELEAEVRGLTVNPSTLNGVYAVFDIGGGTIDGAVFEFEKISGQPSINFLTALVAPLGFEATAEKVRKSIGSDIVAQAIRSGRHSIALPFEDTAKSIRQHVSSVIVLAKQKTLYNWKSKMQSLPVYLCGGGRHSKWHASTIEDTFGCHAHTAAGIPPYKCCELQFSSHEKINLNGAVDVGRYLVSYGLSFPKGTYPEPVGFPKQNPIQTYKKLDITSMLEEKMYELYGELQ